jgi:hypothetical protein
MNVAHMPKPAKIIDLDTVHLLPEAKHVPLLAILSHTGFRDCTIFREQLSFVLFQSLSESRFGIAAHNNLFSLSQ